MVDAELRLVTNLLKDGSYSEPVGRRLFIVAGDLARIVGWASFDAGYHAAAERYWLAGLRAAHSAGDRAVGANILKCMSLQLVDGGRAQEALSIARAAREGASKAPARVVAMLTVREARTHAVLGQARECELLLASAETIMDRADQEPAPDWSDYFDHAEYAAQVAACYLLLKRHQETDQWLSQTLRLQPVARERDRLTYLMWRAEAVMSMGDVEQACSFATEAAPAIATVRSSRNRDRLRRLNSLLCTQAGHLSAVRELDEQVRALVA
jgi:tetratricopeptide (TPR) repeat protein